MSKELTIQSKAQNIKQLLAISKVEIQAALPRHVSPDRMLRVALTCARLNPELLECDQASFLGAIIQSAQLGLEPSNGLGHAYLLPFRNKNSGMREVQFIVGYKGLLDLIYRGANHPTLMPHAVYEGDKFEYQYGTNPQINHIPTQKIDFAKITHVYCVATFPDGRKEFVVMTRSEVEAVKTRSKSATSSFSPWKTDEESMFLKTVLRRISKYLPMSIEAQRAISLDEMADGGESQHNEDLLKTDLDLPKTKRERIEDKISEPSDFDDFNG